MPKYLGFGKCSHFYLYILGSSFFNILKEILLKQTTILKNKGLLQSIFKYCGFIFFGTIFYIKFKINLKDSVNSGTKEKITTRKIEMDDYLKGSKLIYNDNKKNFVISNKEGSLLFIVCFIYVLHLEIIKFLDYFQFYPLEFWTFDVIFVLLLMNLYYPKNIYNHQILSMVFVTLVNSILLIFISICENQNYNNQNIYQHKGLFLCVFAIIIYIDITFLIYYARIHGKITMDIQFISPYKIIIIIGLIGLIFDSFIYLLYFIISNKKCQNNEINIFCYLNIFDYKSEISNNKIRDNIFKEIIITVFFVIFCFIYLICELLVIKYLNPNYILISDNCYFGIIKTIEFISNNNYNNKKFILFEIANVFQFIGNLIYLELIELKFFGLNKNLKINISKRGSEETNNENMIDGYSNSSRSIGRGSENTDNESNFPSNASSLKYQPFIEMEEEELYY